MAGHLPIVKLMLKTKRWVFGIISAACSMAEKGQQRRFMCAGAHLVSQMQSHEGGGTCGVSGDAGALQPKGVGHPPHQEAEAVAGDGCRAGISNALHKHDKPFWLYIRGLHTH